MKIKFFENMIYSKNQNKNRYLRMEQSYQNHKSILKNLKKKLAIMALLGELGGLGDSHDFGVQKESFPSNFHIFDQIGSQIQKWEDPVTGRGSRCSEGLHGFEVGGLEAGERGVRNGGRARVVCGGQGKECGRDGEWNWGGVPDQRYLNHDGSERP